MPGIVSHVYFVSLLFWEWGLLSLSLTLPLSFIFLSPSGSLSLFPPSFGALFLNPPHIMRFSGEWSPNLIALFEWCTLVYLFCFQTVIIRLFVFVFCVSVRIFSLFLFFLFTPCFFGCFWIWTGSLSLLLTCIPYLYLSHLCLVCVWRGSAMIVLIGRNAASDACWLAEIFLNLFISIYYSLLVMWCACRWLCVISVFWYDY